MAIRRAMRGKYIDFISSYCDRWCERCAFTERCSAYAVNVATAMCGGDFEAGLELAIGAPTPRDDAETKRHKAFLEELASVEPTQEETAQWEREWAEQEERIDELPVTTTAETAWLLAHQWLADHAERVSAVADPRLANALQTALWDCHFIRVKLHRALRGRDDFLQGESLEDDPIQNDWNGTAKVTLISIIRSGLAWDVIAGSTGDPDAGYAALRLRQLRCDVEEAFPDAWKFVRPGFDAAPRRRRRRR